MGIFTAMALYDCYEAMAVRRHLLVYSLLRTNLKWFYSMFLGYKEQNCMDHFLIIQQTNRGLFTAMTLHDCYEAMTC